MNHIGLFSGGGIFEMVSKNRGNNIVAFSEIDPYCIRILTHHFPEAENLGNIDSANFYPYENKIDIITGGFPCQPFSMSGERKGIKDNRYKWPEMYRAIQIVKPTWVVAENVPGIINWSKGMVFDEICSNLESEGYEVLPFLLPAIGKDAIHERNRCWFIAFHQPRFMERSKYLGESNITYSNGFGRGKMVSNLQKRQSTRNSHEPLDMPFVRAKIPPCPPLLSMGYEYPTGLDNISLPEWRQQSIKMFGNAIYPDVFIEILSTIEEFNKIFICDEN